MNGKTLYRVMNGKMIAGVCTGLSEYLNIDVNVIRILTVIAGCIGFGVIAYIVAAIILPIK